MICLESGSESESDSLKKRCGPSEWIGSDCDDMKNLGSTSKFDSAGSGPSIGRFMLSLVSFSFFYWQFLQFLLCRMNKSVFNFRTSPSLKTIDINGSVCPGNDDLQEISGDTKPSTVGRDDYIYQVVHLEASS